MSLPSPDLRVLSCDGCGACCAEQGAPPDYVALRMSPHLAEDASFAEDLVRYQSLVGEPLRLLEQYFTERSAGLRSENGVCVWFDAANCNCRFYDLRPSTCRVFELDSPGCRLYRRRQGVGVEPSGCSMGGGGSPLNVPYQSSEAASRASGSQASRLNRSPLAADEM